MPCRSVSRIASPADVQNALGALYMLVSCLTTVVGFGCIANLVQDCAVSARERSARTYGAGPYLAAQALVEMAYATPQALAFTAIAYALMRAPPTVGAFMYVLLLAWLGCIVTYLMMQARTVAMQHARLRACARGRRWRAAARCTYSYCADLVLT